MFDKINTKFTAKALTAVALIGMTVLGTTGCGSRTAPTAQINPAFNRGVQTQRALSTQRSTSFRRFSSSTAQIPAGYYDAVQGQTGQDLLQTLNNIVARHKDLGYSHGRDIMFSTVDDLDNDDVIEGVYTGRRLDKVNNRGSAYRNGSGINTEHTWPKSKGAKSGPAKSDLHHLFPTDIKTNSARSSFPFGNVSRTHKSFSGSKLGSDARGRTVFEPRDQHKGNVARALFYFYTVYGRNGISTSNFRVEHDTLLAWHRQDPVDAAERARNQAIFEAQGNRNPYVDHPEYVGAIGQFMR